MTESSRFHLDRWRTIVSQRDGQELLAMLAEDVVFRSPFQWRPHQGRQATGLILSTVSEVFQDFTYHRELIDGNNWALEFSARVGDLSVKGIDLIRLNDGRYTLLCLRPGVFLPAKTPGLKATAV